MLNRGGFFLSSPVGHQAYLSPTLQLTHRVINKVAKETGFPCIPTINKRDGGGGGEVGAYSKKYGMLKFSCVCVKHQFRAYCLVVDGSGGTIRVPN